MSDKRGNFGRVGFILAAAGSAVGLGNIWKFPYITYENNGGSFVLIYLAAIVLVGFPIMMAEIIIGRSTQKSTVSAFIALKKPAWSALGYLGVATGFIILSYYSVVAGWTVQYFIKCISWSVQGFTPGIENSLSDNFSLFLSNGAAQIGFHGLFILMNILIVVFGVENGIERISKFIMPILFVILLVLAVNSYWTQGFKSAMVFLFKPSKINPSMLLEAVGHAFFTLSLGMGAIITYGSYMKKTDSIPKSAGMICLMDTVVALLSCIIMFSIIFSVPELERQGMFSKSIVIMFTTLPKMFYQLPGGAILAPLFYLLVTFAALTSAISLLEVVVAYFIDQLHWSRIRATLILGTAIFAFGILSALSLGYSTGLSNWKPFGDYTAGFFDTMDYLASNWLLPVGGMLIAIFTGWVLKSSFTRKMIEEGHGHFMFHGVWIFLLRFVCPIAIGWIIYSIIFSGVTFN